MKMPFVELTWKNLAKTLAKKYFPGKFKKSSHSKHFPRGLSSRKPLPQMEQSDQDDFDMCPLSSTDSDSELPQSMPTPKPKEGDVECLPVPLISTKKAKESKEINR